MFATRATENNPNRIVVYYRATDHRSHVEERIRDNPQGRTTGHIVTGDHLVSIAARVVAILVNEPYQDIVVNNLEVNPGHTGAQKRINQELPNNVIIRNPIIALTDENRNIKGIDLYIEQNKS